ncbi:unnamed protein product [Lupinus luteus]|uniref:Bulb-type lectin domain-containing protein n=1 Tax=Lupinus luteus TaxID=3873 RepID=A0AAV1W369_LUPLU
MWLWLLWTSSCIIVKAANHTLKQGDSLNGTNKLCSDGSYYCIGFVAQPGGLSYLTITSDTKNNPWEVWIANRNEPIFNNSGLLSLDHSGVLKIESQGRKPIVLYTPPPQSTNKNSIVATILDTGNFLVQQLHPNGSTMSVLWQSFDYPTDCLLPGMKLGVNHKTGQNWSLVSWVSETFPAPGSFRLEWEPREHELIMKREEQVIWKSGKLINNRFFENIQKESQHIYQYNQVSNEDEDYFIFTTPNTKEPTKWALFETGELIGSEVKEIARADNCYGYNTDRGCQKWEIPTCRKPGDAFDSREGYPNTSGNDTSIEPNKMYGIGDCQASCWSNCSCVGFKSYDDSGGTGCIFFYGKTLDGATLVSVGQKFNMLVKKPHHKGTNKWIWIGTAIATFLLIICSAILCLAIMKRKYMLKDKRRMESETQGLADSDDGSAGIFSTKSDVYSYGVLLLEIVSGRMNNSCCDDDQPLNLVGHAWELWNDGVCLELMDPSLNDTFVPEEVQRCIHVGLLCVEHYAKDRPDMSDIISMLTNKTAPVTMPRRPAFYVGRQMGDGGTSSKSVESNTFYSKEISDSSEIESR